jgi:hypothetical protein
MHDIDLTDKNVKEVLISFAEPNDYSLYQATQTKPSSKTGIGVPLQIILCP